MPIRGGSLAGSSCERCSRSSGTSTSGGAYSIDWGAAAAESTATGTILTDWTTSGVGETMAVIGRQTDTAAAKGWPGYEILDLRGNDWSLARNDQWVESVISRKMPVYVGSNTTWSNLWDAAAGRATVFGRELQQFLSAGYTWDGWTLVPPGGG